MAIVESVLIALGVGVAKYLVKEILPEAWQDQIAAELVSLGVRQVTGRQAEDPVAKTIGKGVATLYRRSSLADNDKSAVLAEVIGTLARANTGAQRLVELDLDAEQLGRQLIALRPQATAHFSGDEAALYEQMLREAGRGMMRIAHRLDGFHTAQARAQLGRQRRQLDQQAETLSLLQALATSLANWLEGPTEQARRFEQEIYRPAVVRKLNKMEPFGIEEGDRYADTLKLVDSFVEPDLLLTLWVDDPAPDQMRLFPDAAREERLGKQERRLPVFQALASVQRLMVVGAAGSGKSTFLQWLALCAAQQSFPESLAEWNTLAPFFIRLRDYQDRGFPTPEAFTDKITPMGSGAMPAGWVRDVLRRGQGLVLVDGVDEMRREDREQMLAALQDLVAIYPLSRFVVTSRPPVVDETSWPAWHAWLQEARFTESRLVEMRWPQIETFVGRWHEALQRVTPGQKDKRQIERNNEGAVKLLQRKAALRRLAATPLLCAMICALYQRQKDHIAAERLELYESCVEMLLWERDRKHPRRQVPALADYPQFSKTQLLKLLSHLAYWMMDEAKSAVSCERALRQFQDYLPRLGLDASGAEQAFAYFDERASMWDEAVIGYVEFRHRTFQEYLAAGWAMQQDKVGALAERAANPQWRETIVLAAGRAAPAQSWRLLQEILQRAEDAPQADLDAGRYLLLLALDCLETCSELPDSAHWQEVVARARPAFPPHSREEAEMVASGGSYAIDLLAYDRDYPAEIADYCIQALAAIGGERALQAIAAYGADERRRVRRAMGDAWSQFETRRYAEQVLAGWQALSLSAIPADVERLSLLPNLAGLDLRYTPVSDLSPLAGLPNLAQLFLLGTQVSDLSPLAGLPNLAQLVLSYTPVSDLSPLAGLPNLAQLVLSYTQVSDLSPLAGLPNLAQLDLSGAPVSDLSPLAGMPNLVQLFLINTPVSDLSPLAGMPNLVQLFLHGSQVSDLSPLAGLPNLAQLFLFDTQVSDLSPLAGLPNLAGLDLSYTPVSDLSPLAGLPNLAHLSLTGAPVRDLSLLAGLPNLAHLSLTDAQVSDLSLLAGLPNLAQLFLLGTQVSDLSPLAGLPNLAQLDLRYTQVSDLSPLAGLPNLAWLDLSGAPVSDLSPLAGLPNLAQLFLFDTQVSDLSPLAGLPNLAQLDLRGAQASDLSPLAGLANLTELVIKEERAAEAVSALAAGRRRGLAIYTDSAGGNLYRYLPPGR